MEDKKDSSDVRRDDACGVKIPFWNENAKLVHREGGVLTLSALYTWVFLFIYLHGLNV